LASAEQPRLHQSDQSLRNWSTSAGWLNRPPGLGRLREAERGIRQWAESGVSMQSMMLLAREHGHHATALQSRSLWFCTMAEFVGMPRELLHFWGVALGFVDSDHPIRRLCTERAPISEFVMHEGF
jgi:hypothetical protein